MLTKRQLQRRFKKVMKRRQIHKLSIALKQYPHQMQLRDQYIATLKHNLEVYQQTVAALTKRVKELETVYAPKQGIIRI